ncbi:MAG: tetratricopeptide repeat protein [Phycisphaerae bacterium]|jgi:tetratricopeptide (TPR) repeat protein
MNDWFEAEQRVERAQQLSESMRWDEALAELDVALAINPNNATWNAQRGYILEELERFDEAVAAYQAALSLEQGDRDVTAALGGALCRLGRFSQAVETFEELARHHPDFEPAYCHRIGIYAELGRHEDAEQMFYLAQALNDACPHCFFHMGSSLAARGDMERALFCWRRVLQIEPDYIGVNRRIAQTYRAKGDLDTARQYYVREIRDDPGNTDVLFELGDLLLDSRKTAAAAAKFAQILELEPEHVDARFALGEIWLLRAQPERALACFQTVETFTDARETVDGFDLAIGEALLRLGRFEEAHPHLEHAYNERSTDTRAAMLLGECLIARKRLSPAADAFRSVLAVDASDALARFKLGSCLFAMGQCEAGLAHFIGASEAKPDFKPALHAAALSCVRLGKWRDARKLLQRALRLEPDDPELLRLRRRLPWYRAGRLLRAIADVIRRITGRS